MVSLPGALRLIGRHGPRWLYAGGNRSDRWRDPDAVVGALGLRNGNRVADIGAGYGTFTGRLARAVAPAGLVYAVDADLALLERLERRARDAELGNVVTVAARGARLELPEPVDLLFGAAVFHHLPAQVAYFTDARALLRPGGRVAILESRREGLLRGLFPHGTPPADVRATMRAAGYLPLAELQLVRGHLFAFFAVDR
ncbi:MAG: class I SAM-dependent methyltransferase [Chloroflexota bacterium]